MSNKNQKKIIKAFLDFENNVRSNFDVESMRDYETAAKGYAESIKGFVLEAGLDCEVIEGYNYNEDQFSRLFENFQNYMRRYVAQLRARLVMVDEDTDGGVHEQEFLKISSSYKVEIHDRLNQIRKIVAVAELPIDKRDLIYNKISALGLEVDRDRTRLGTVMSNILDMSAAAGQASKNAEPLIKKIESLIKPFSGAKAETEQLLIDTDDVKSLPAPDED